MPTLGNDSEKEGQKGSFWNSFIFFVLHTATFITFCVYIWVQHHESCHGLSEKAPSFLFVQVIILNLQRHNKEVVGKVTRGKNLEVKTFCILRWLWFCVSGRAGHPQGQCYDPRQDTKTTNTNALSGSYPQRFLHGLMEYLKNDQSFLVLLIT